MKNLRFTYRMSLQFDSSVCDHYFALRCVPADDELQKIMITNQYVSPADCINEVTDGFGNRKYVGYCMKNHSEFAYAVEGTAVVEGMKVRHEELHPMYKYPSKYTQVGESLRRLIVSAGWMDRRMQGTAEAKAETACVNAGGKGGTNLELAIGVMQYLYEHFTYESGVTDIYTTAEEACALGSGVCQDYAHIMIAVLRFLGVPARYVNGMMIGEGRTHAWVEVYTGDGWYGLDPTNNLHVDDYYIKLAHGRDYQDCVLDKGRFLGCAGQHQEIYVNVKEEETLGNDNNNCFDGAAGGRTSGDQKEPDHTA